MVYTWYMPGVWPYRSYTWHFMISGIYLAYDTKGIYQVYAHTWYMPPVSCIMIPGIYLLYSIYWKLVTGYLLRGVLNMTRYKQDKLVGSAATEPKHISLDYGVLPACLDRTWIMLNMTTASHDRSVLLAPCSRGKKRRCIWCEWCL